MLFKNFCCYCCLGRKRKKSFKATKRKTETQNAGNGRKTGFV